MIKDFQTFVREFSKTKRNLPLNESVAQTTSFIMSYYDDRHSRTYRETVSVPSQGIYFVINSGNDEGFAGAGVFPSTTTDPNKFLAGIIRDAVSTLVKDGIYSISDNVNIEDVEYDTDDYGLYIGEIDLGSCGVSTVGEFLKNKNAQIKAAKRYLDWLRETHIDRDSSSAYYLFIVKDGNVLSNVGSTDGDPNMYPAGKNTSSKFKKIEKYIQNFVDEVNSWNISAQNIDTIANDAASVVWDILDDVTNVADICNIHRVRTVDVINWLNARTGGKANSVIKSKDIPVAIVSNNASDYKWFIFIRPNAGKYTCEYAGIDVAGDPSDLI
jgi:hypothetical protein